MQTDQEWFDQGIKLFGKKEFASALQMFQRITAPDLEVMKLYHMGMCLVNLGRLDDALSHYRAVRNHPQMQERTENEKVIYGLFINMGSILQVLAKKKGPELWQEARDCYLQAQTIDDTDARVWNNLGNCYLDLHQYPEAERALKKAAELDDEFAGPHYSLSLVYEYTQRYSEAISEHHTGRRNCINTSGSNRHTCNRSIRSSPVRLERRFVIQGYNRNRRHSYN